MPLTPEEGEEYRQDGLNVIRREAFRAARQSRPSMTFEEYLHWLEDLQRLFPQPTTPFRPPLTHRNRL